MNTREGRVVQAAGRFSRLQAEDAVEILVVREDRRAKVDVPRTHAGSAECRAQPLPRHRIGTQIKRVSIGHPASSCAARRRLAFFPRTMHG
jgi:hypothetical protein